MNARLGVDSAVCHEQRTFVRCLFFVLFPLL